MAPELIKKEKYDKSIDIWALGILLYEMLHGRSPFAPEENSLNKKMSIHNKRAVIQNNILYKKLTFKNGLSEDCLDLLQKLLESNSEKRIKIDEILKHPFLRPPLVPRKMKSSNLISAKNLPGLNSLSVLPVTTIHRSNSKKKIFLDI